MRMLMIQGGCVALHIFRRCEGRLILSHSLTFFYIIHLEVQKCFKSKSAATL